MVSIIIATYNYGKFIPDTLDSVIAQTDPDFECIIVDNGSTDDTKKIVAAYLSDSRLKYIYQENNGVSAARNTAMQLAKGDYIMFLDSDDRMEKDKLKASVEFLEQNQDVSLVYTDMRYFRTDDLNTLYYNYNCDSSSDQPWMKYVSGHGQTLAATILQGNIMAICSPLFRVSLLNEIGLFDPAIHYNEDWDFWMRMVLADKKIRYLDKPFTKVLVRIHNTSLSKDVFKMQVFGLKVLLKNSDKLKSFGLNKELAIRIDDHVKGINYTLTHSNYKLFKTRIERLKQMGIYSTVFSHEFSNLLFMKLYLKINSFFN